MKKLAVFDFDSTLMDGETIDFLAEENGLKNQVVSITNKAMSGEIDFYTSLLERVSLLKGLPYIKVKEICEELPIMNGAKELIRGLKEKDYIVICFSGGFRDATKPICEKLGIKAEFSNFLHITEDGVLSGLVGGEMMYSDAKGDMLIRLQALLEIDRTNTMVIGDGANDLSMFAHADTRIAFCAKDILKNEATHCINIKDLRGIIKIAK